MPSPRRPRPEVAGPFALLARLTRVAPVVRAAAVAAVGAGLVGLLATVAQAVALADLLGGLARDAHRSVLGPATWFAAARVRRALAAGLTEPVVGAIAAPARRALRRRFVEETLTRGAPGGADAAIQSATRGVAAIEGFLARTVPAVTLAALAPVALIVWLFTRDWLSAVIVTSTVLLLPVFMVLLGLAARDQMAARWRDHQRLADYFGDVVRGMTVLKGAGRSRAAVATLDEASRSLTDSTMATLRTAFLSGLALELLASVATALVAMVLGLRLINGSMSLTTALAVLIVTPEVYWPLRRAAAQYHASADAVAAAGDLLGVVERVRPVPGAAPSPTRAPRVEFVATVAVNRDRPSRAEPFSGVCPAGAVTVVRGPSGVGKTTLLRAIAGLADVAEGEVLIDGVDLAELEPGEWRRRLAWLPQDPRLPAGSVRDVVRLGASVEDTEIERGLESVGLDLALDRQLSEGASELSAGERRRLALVRAMVREPLVVLLDEPTAHLDAASARQVEEAVRAIRATRIVVTHRDFPHDVALEVVARRVEADARG